MPEPVTPPARVLLCLEAPCHGEFYMPLDLDERIVCPFDSEHRVVVYSGPIIHAGRSPESTHKGD